ncbi:MAG: pyridoxamine 5'-phosphate oxidase family protein, partial [Anaerolineaceae bacterium]
DIFATAGPTLKLLGLDSAVSPFLNGERLQYLSLALNGLLFLAPMFYTWFDDALCGLTTPGTKTRLAERNASVAFQVDSTVTSGIWEWTSVTGAGAWEAVGSPREFGPFAAQLGERLADQPDWTRATLQGRFRDLGMVAWRIRPVRLSGKQSLPGV